MSIVASFHLWKELSFFHSYFWGSVLSPNFVSSLLISLSSQKGNRNAIISAWLRNWNKALKFFNIKSQKSVFNTFTVFLKFKSIKMFEILIHITMSISTKKSSLKDNKKRNMHSKLIFLDNWPIFRRVERLSSPIGSLIAIVPAAPVLRKWTAICPLSAVRTEMDTFCPRNPRRPMPIGGATGAERCKKRNGWRIGLQSLRKWGPKWAWRWPSRNGKVTYTPCRWNYIRVSVYNAQ